jgi:hypothetical protein
MPKTRAPATPDRPLTPKQARFCEDYLIDLNATQAAIRAGYSVRTAKEIGYALLLKPLVQARVQQLQAARAEATKITAERVLEELWAIATADPRELIEYRRTCCRHCWGTNHDEQRTAREIAIATASWEQWKEKKPEDVFDLKGGAGYDARKHPNPKCPECFGEGREHVFVHDTRRLSPNARRLYAGVKTTKEGIEVKTLDQQGALVSVGKHLGMFVDKLEVRNTTLEDVIRAAASEDASAGHQ